MKPILVIVAFLLWGGNQTFAQATKCTNTATYCGLLAPNPGCASNAPYCRAAVTAIIPSDSSTIPQIIGGNKGILYSALSVKPPNACPQSSVSAGTYPETLCFYSSSSFNPESWQYLGQYSFQTLTSPIAPIEVVFAPGPCNGANYQYLYTEGAHLLRAPFNDWNNFTDIISNINFSGQGIPPNIPPDTGARPGSFAIGTDSSGGVRLFYGNYNDHSYPPTSSSPPQPTPPGGLIWHSTDCRGDSWSQPFTFGGREVHSVNADPAHPSNIYATIDAECSPDGQVCPSSQQARGLWGSTNSGDNFTQLASAATSKLGIDFAFLSKGVVLEADDCAAGPLLYQDLVANHAMEVQVKWPDSSWGGDQLGIKLTSAGNIFVISDVECPNNSRWGIWYVLQPAYSGAILLENMGSTAPGAKINRTVEVKDPTTKIAYLYNYMTRFVEPIASPAPPVSEPLGNKPWDFGVWVGGGFSVPGGTTDTQVVNVGVRLGKVLTGNHGSGFVRGNFEWSADVMPLYYLVQPGQNAYAAGFNPVNLKWNFTSHSKVVPYLELGGGVLFSNNNVPAVSNTDTNFLTHVALGFHFFTRENRAFTLSTRYEHISNAGLASPNPGINTVQFAVGFNWFK